MARRVITESLCDFSLHFTKFHKLPNGVQLRVWNVTDKRWVRQDFTIKRHALTPASAEQFDGGTNVTALLEHAESLLSMELSKQGRRREFRLAMSDGTHILGGTHLETVRAIPETSSDASDAKAKRTFGLLLALVKITTSAKKRDALYDELRAILDQSFEKALIDNLSSIARRKS